MSMKNYIPQFKTDEQAIECLNSLAFETVRADVPELLEWVQDLHWDSAHGVAKYLVPHVHEIQEELLDILKTNDEIWKFNIIKVLIAKSPNKLGPELMSMIRRIADHPTKAEKEEDVDVAASEIIYK